MTKDNHYVELLNEILDGNDSGDFVDPSAIPDKYTYEHLLAAFNLADSLDGGEDLFRQLYHTAMKCCESHVRDKAKSGEKLKVAFMSYSAAQWPAELLYRDMEKDDRFDPYIIVSPLTNRDYHSSMCGYTQTVDWYKSTNHRIIEGYDIKNNLVYTWQGLGGIPDIVIHLSSWYECIPEPQQFIKLPWRCLNIYIPYGMSIVDSQGDSYVVNDVYNKDIVNMMWRVYIESKIHLPFYKKYQMIHGDNVLYSGYMKMDELIQPDEYTNDDIRTLWKIPSDKNAGDVRRILVAPHYSIFDNGSVLFSTFRENAFFWLYLMQKYSDKVSFVFKPHPNLRAAAVGTGMFKSYEDYDNYLDFINSLPNARTVDESSYIDLFNTSEGIIMDSASFVGEYLYTGKPGLFLTRPTQKFNSLGESCILAYYKENGRDYYGIDQFIKDVIIDKADSMLQKRKMVFEQNLDYLHENGKFAHEFVFEDICNLIGE